MQVPGERAKSANARHECFVMDASVSVKTAETAELDEREVWGRAVVALSLWCAASGPLAARTPQHRELDN
jgi:hypothetical protein